MKTYNITDFGARCSDTLQTEAIQKALDTCFLEGGGTVVVPAGIYLTGGLRLRSNTTLHLKAGAMLRGSRDPEDYNAWMHDAVEPIVEYEHEGVSRSAYPYTRWNNAILRAIGAHDIAVIGEPGSFINGSNCFDEQGEEKYRGPHPINFWDCENVKLEGYTVYDGGNWGHAIFRTNNITARNLTVYGGHDGFDIRTCDNVLIEDCVFRTGDDCIAGFDNRDVVIRRCMLDCACSALRFGGTRVLVEDCTAVSPASFGFRGHLRDEEKKEGTLTTPECRHLMHMVFNYYCDFRANIRETPGDILIRNCTFRGMHRLFSLNFDGEHIWCCNRSLRSIRFENCRAEGLTHPILIHGDASEPLILELSNVSLGFADKREEPGVIDAVNFERITLDNVQFENYTAPEILLRSEGTVDGNSASDVRIVRN